MRATQSSRPYLTDATIERLSREELVRANLYPVKPEPIRIDRFLEKRFGSGCIEFEDLAENVLGYTRFTNEGVDKIVISLALVDEQDPVTRRRLNTTLAHEAGHALLHAGLFKTESVNEALFDGDPDVAGSRILCREPGQPRYDGRWWELQANKMMAALLLPPVLVTLCIDSLLEAPGLMGAPQLPAAARTVAARAVSDAFDVNPIAAKYRLATLFPETQSTQLTL